MTTFEKSKKIVTFVLDSFQLGKAYLTIKKKGEKSTFSLFNPNQCLKQLISKIENTKINTFVM